MAAYKRKRGSLAEPAINTKKAKKQPPGTQQEGAAGEEFTVPKPVSAGKWKNKERVLIFSSRGINFRTRHLMQDLRTLMPHTKAETKMDRKDKLFVVNEVCEMKNCNKCIYFEAKKKQDLYMWLSNSPEGPSAKFLVQNIHTLAELKMSGNCLKGSRPILSFDPAFDRDPHYALLKELLTQVIEEDAALVEIGPRFVLNLIKIFKGSFGGPTLYENPHYQSPNMHRRMIRMATAAKVKEKQQVKELQKMKKEEDRPVIPADPTESVFYTPAEEKPQTIETEPPAPKPKVKRKDKQFKRQRMAKKRM
ncbi:hypothetical protein XENTR_v10003032 [Xenopus tropicalis]|nr:hypothetical protein XENTR_v10003032 [Xenopus tropicalis]